MQSLPIEADRLDKEHAPTSLELINEKLEMAIEQLRLANEALEVTGHELGTLNNQLEMMNEEMERLRQEVIRLREGYAHAFEHVPYPVVLADKEGKIEGWNTAAQQLFHLALEAWVGSDLSEFPVQPSLGRALRRKHRAVIEGGTTLMLSNQLVRVKRAIHRMDVHFTALSRERSSQGVLIMFVSAPARDGLVSRWERSGNNMVDSAAS
jgi:nitrogen fixation/metabolism regulation signal transduction histidine kinase